MPITLHPSFAFHPGEWLHAELVEPHALSVTNTADRLGVTRQTVSNLLNGRAGLSTAMALYFEGAFGVSADTLMRTQAVHDLARERGVQVERVAT